MTCESCENQQSRGYGTFVEIGTANVFVCGCDKHLKEMFNLLRKGGEKNEHDNRVKEANKGCSSGEKMG